MRASLPSVGLTISRGQLMAGLFIFTSTNGLLPRVITSIFAKIGIESQENLTSITNTKARFGAMDVRPQSSASVAADQECSQEDCQQSH